MSKPIRVLIVEDSEPDTFLLLRHLRQGGFEPAPVLRVETAAALAGALTSQTWDVVIADYRLPQFTGLDALRMVQATGLDAPFILVSGAIGEEQAAAVMKAGAHALLLKDRASQLPFLVERELEDAEVRRQRVRAEAALMESEQRYRSLFDGSLDGIFAVDATGRLLQANQSATRISGYTVEELTARNFAELCAPDQLAATQAAFLDGMAGAPREIETAMIRKDGRRVELFVSGSAIRSEGNVRGLFCVAKDITERKHAMETLQQREQLLKEIIDGSPAPIFIKDLDGKFITINAALERMLGMSRTELAGKTDYDIAPRKLADEWRASDKKVIETGRAIQIEEEADLPDGHHVFLANKFPLVNLCGETYGVGAISHDITDRKQAEEALRRSEEFARNQWSEAQATLEAVPANIAILDANGVILRVNRSWSEFAVQNGMASGAATVGINYLAVCDAAQGKASGPARKFATGLRSVIRRRTAHFSMEYSCHSPAEQRWFIGYVTAIPGEGSARAVVAHVNITPQKLIEEKIRTLNDELENRVIERTFELNASVNALEAQIVERQRLEREILKISDHEQSRIGRDLHDGTCQNLASIAVLAEVAGRELKLQKSVTADNLQEIAELARQSANETRRLAAGLFPVKIEFNGLEWALRELAAETGARGNIRCAFDMRSPFEFTDVNAAVQVYRIAQEAVGNAIRHGQASRIAVELSESGGMVRLSVEDDGIGLLENVSKDGLGLHTMQYRATMLGGSLEITRATPHGTIVTCSFPGKDFIHVKKIDDSKETGFSR